MISREPSYSEVKKIVEWALKQFGKNDLKLLEYSIDEYAYPYHIACYLERKFCKFGYDVDCEYNKVGKTGEIKKDDPQNQVGIDPQKKRGVRPDIIIHQRGEIISNNFLVIEIKKAENRNISRDRKKLKFFTLQKGGQLQYRYGLLLLISREKYMVSGEFFENGNRSKDKNIGKFCLKE
jgi:hypothetical protein